MMILVIHTQDHENYGSRWKAKGGSEYKVLGVPSNIDVDALVDTLRGEIERDSDSFRSTIIGYNLEQDDYLSWFERSQLEHEGRIVFPEPQLEYADFIGL